MQSERIGVCIGGTGSGLSELTLGVMSSTLFPSISTSISHLSDCLEHENEKGKWKETETEMEMEKEVEMEMEMEF